MTKAKNNEGYGRYIQLILTASDLILLNIIFVLTCLLSHDMIREHARVTMFLVNLSYLPIALWFKNNTSQRTIYMDHIFLRVIQTVGIHAPCPMCSKFGTSPPKHFWYSTRSCSPDSRFGGQSHDASPNTTEASDATSFRP